MTIHYSWCFDDLKLFQPFSVFEQISIIMVGNKTLLPEQWISWRYKLAHTPLYIAPYKIMGLTIVAYYVIYLVCSPKFTTEPFT